MATNPEMKWCVSWMKCRLCDHVHISAYPTNVLDEEALQCPTCDHMTCEPCSKEEGRRLLGLDAEAIAKLEEQAWKAPDTIGPDIERSIE